MWIILTQKSYIDLLTFLNESSVHYFEISWDIYRSCQREKERMKGMGGGRQLTSPYCKAIIQSLCDYFFWSHFIEIFHRKRQLLLVLQADFWSLASDLPNCFILGATRSDLKVHVSRSSLSASCMYGANNKVFASLQGFVFHSSKASTPEQLTVAALLKCPKEQSIWIVKYPIRQLCSHCYCLLPQNSNLIAGTFWGRKIQRSFQCKYIEEWLINHKWFRVLAALFLCLTSINPPYSQALWLQCLYALWAHAVLGAWR